MLFWNAKFVVMGYKSSRKLIQNERSRICGCVYIYICVYMYIKYFIQSIIFINYYLVCLQSNIYYVCMPICIICVHNTWITMYTYKCLKYLRNYYNENSLYSKCVQMIGSTLYVLISFANFNVYIDTFSYKQQQFRSLILLLQWYTYRVPHWDVRNSFPSVDEEKGICPLLAFPSWPSRSGQFLRFKSCLSSV